MIVRTAPASQPGRRGTSLWLWCPGCEQLHRVQFGGTAGEQLGPQWTWDGDRVKPTISPSILVHGAQWPPEYPEFVKHRHPSVEPGDDTRCHSFVRDGQWQFLPDSTHVLAGQTVPCVPIPDGIFTEDAAGG